METKPLPGNAENSAQHVNFIKPFENIALAFSGGGFRAATFALGVLSYLNEVGFDGDDPLKGRSLLDQVTYLSSSSSGTITTALYALYDAQGKTFGEFYVKLFDTLAGDQLLKDALELLADKKRWAKRPDKARNIINAFAMAYDEYLFEGETIKALFYKEGTSHLQEVCFNTTEFYTGLSFRQDKKMAPDADPDPCYKFGNDNIFLDQAVAAKYKLGDVLAASSCFPAGFEPIVFPEDFTHEGLTEDELKKGLTLNPQTGDKAEKAFIAEKRIGFMDGGITDNQGLQSMMYADGRRINHQTTFKPFDLMLVNDVDSYFIPPYINPPKPKDKGISLSGLSWVMFFVLVAAVACGSSGFVCHQPVLTLASGILFVVPAIFFGVRYLLRKTIMGEPGKPSGLRKIFTQSIINLLLHYFTKSPLSVLKEMLLARGDSVFLLNTGVFMKRIRQLIYNTFYGSARWKNRGKGNHIYDLAFSSDIYRAQHPPTDPFLNPSRDIQIVAQVAYNMGVTLWFDKTDCNQEHSEACIIACGQFTTCYNLLEYIDKLRASHNDIPTYDQHYDARLTHLKRQLTDDYTHFKTDPFFMYNQYGIDNHIKDFKALTVKDIPFPENWE